MVILGLLRSAEALHLHPVCTAMMAKSHRERARLYRRLIALILFAGRSQAVNKVHDTQPWMRPDEARAGVSHHFPDAAALAGRVAVDRTFAAGALAFLERTLLKPCQDIAQQGNAVGAKGSALVVMIPAVPADHEFNRARLTSHSGR